MNTCEKVINIEIDLHDFAEMISKKEIFLCVGCAKYKSVSFVWSYLDGNDYQCAGVCNPCNDKLNA